MAEVILERQTYILVHDTEELLFPSEAIFPSNDIYPQNTMIVSNIIENTMNLSEILCENELAFGQMYATKFEVQVYDTEDLSGKYITVVQEEDNQAWYVFSGLIDSCKLDRLGTERTIVAYDLAYTKSFSNVADWWATFWNTHTTTTLKAFREALLDYMDVRYENIPLMNDNAQFVKMVDITSISFSALLKMVCELSCCFPHYDRNAVLKFVSLNPNAQPKEMDTEIYESKNSDFQEYVTDEITGVQFYSRTSEILATVGTEDNLYSVTENFLIYGMETSTINSIGTNMLNYMADIQYRPSSVSMIISDFSYKLGDLIQTDYSEFYVLKMDCNGVQLIEQKLIANGNSSREGVGTEISVPETLLVENVEILDENVDNLVDDVEDVIEDVADLYNDMELFKRQWDVDNDHIESIITTAGGETWDTDKWEDIHTPSTIDIIDEGDPTVEYELDEEVQWDNYGLTIEDICDTKPDPKDYDDTYDPRPWLERLTKPAPPEYVNEDEGKYFMDGRNGDIYQYTLHYYPINLKDGILLAKTSNVIFAMEKVHDGRRLNNQKIWIVTPDAEVGNHYIDWSNGKVYRLDTNTVGEAPYKWTYIDTCPTKAQVLSTRIKQTAHSITLEAQNDTSGRAVGLKIQLYNEDGTPLLPTQANLTFNGLASFTDLEGTGTTFINGGHIQTDTLEVSTIKPNSTDEKGDNMIDFSYGLQSSMVYASALLAKGVNNTSIDDRLSLITRPASDTSRTHTIHLGTLGGEVFYALNKTAMDAVKADDEASIELGLGWSVNSSSTIVGKTYGPRIDHSDYWVTDATVYCNAPLHYPIFPYLRSSSTVANVRCRNNDYGAPFSEETYRFAPISQSSQRWKHDIKPVEDEILDPHRLYDLEVDQFIYNLDYLDEEDMRYDTPVIGFIAEKVAQVYPIAAEKNTRDGQVENWNERYIIPPMLKLIQEQNERITALEEQIKQLQKED